MKERRAPLRRCAVCGRQRSKRELLRLLRTPEGEVLWDPTGRRAGRGLYICRDGPCVETGLEVRVIERQFGVRPDPAAMERLREELRRLAGGD